MQGSFGVLNNEAVGRSFQPIMVKVVAPCDMTGKSEEQRCKCTIAFE